jgi:hypothetical protein
LVGRGYQLLVVGTGFWIAAIEFNLSNKVDYNNKVIFFRVEQIFVDDKNTFFVDEK